MKLLIAVALGGGRGADARYQSVDLLARWLGPGFPYGILFVNVTGSFLMGLLVELLVARAGVGPELRAFFLVGVFGAFTTFSSFALDVWSLVERDAVVLAVLYVAASVALSLLALVAGLQLGRSLMS